MKIGLVGIDQSNTEEIQTIKDSSDIKISGYYNIYDALLSDLSFQDLTQSSDFESLLTDSDALFFFDSLDKYYELALNGVKAGKHILLKTIYGTSEDKINKLFKISKEANIKIQILQTLKFHPLIGYTINNINTPHQVEVRRMNSLPDNTEMIFNHLTNDISLILQYLHGNVKKIHTRKSPFHDNYYDFISTRIEFDNGSEALIKYIFLTEKSSLKLEIFDKGRSTVLDFSKNKCIVYQRKEAKVLKQTPLFELYEPLEKEFNFFISNCQTYDSPQYNETSKDSDLISIVMEVWKNLNL